MREQEAFFLNPKRFVTFRFGFQVTLSKESENSRASLRKVSTTLTAISLCFVRSKEKQQLCKHPRSFLLCNRPRTRELSSVKHVRLWKVNASVIAALHLIIKWSVKKWLIWGYYPSRMNIPVYLDVFYLFKDDFNENTLREVKHMKMAGATMHHG